MSLEEAVAGVNALGGLVIPAHVERRAYGLLAMLGFAPPIFEALEISKHVSVAEACELFPELRTFPLLQSGDVHYADGFIGVMAFEMDTPTVSEIRKAIHSEGGRKMRISTAN
jgi:PHP family Zn ribbon phosphoesterase